MGELYRRYWRAARAAAYGATGDLTLAEDAASEAFCAALEGLHGLRDTDRFGPWLRTIVLRTARRLKAVQAMSRMASSHPRPEKSDQAPEIQLQQQELAALIREAAARLPQMLREAICLFYFEGYNVEQAARFLDIPTGTFKRRLHEGRRRLHATTEQILKGAKPMNTEQEEILRRLREAADEGPDSERFYQAVREALRLRPVPPDLVREIMHRRRDAHKPVAAAMTPEKERLVREAMSRVYDPSERARNPDHPVGAVAQAIRAALPDFQSWQVDVSRIDFARVAKDLRENPGRAFSFLSPPGFESPAPVSYVSATRTLLVKDEDGSVVTMHQLMQRKASRDAFLTQMKRGARLSDVLMLQWRQTEPLELRAIEERLRSLSATVVPRTPACFCPFEEPHFRSALRMQLGANPIPAALGGVLTSSPDSPEALHGGSVLICLEPWAAARSGQVIELADDVPFPLFG